MSVAHLVQVAVAAPLRGLFTYSVVDPMVLRPGQLVEVPFGRSLKRGVVVGHPEQPPENIEIKPVGSLVEAEPVLGPDVLATLLWAADYYLMPQGEMVFAGLPPVFRKSGRSARGKSVMVASLVNRPTPEDLSALEGRAPRQAQALAAVQQAGTIEVRALEQRFSGARQALQGLVRKGWVRLQAESRARRPKPISFPTAEPVLQLSDEQGEAVAAIRRGQDQAGFETFLLHGVTGSGKTEVYLRAIEQSLSSGRGAILLVPEISLTPQLMDRVTARFGERAAVLHSGLGQGERLDEWRRLQSGQALVAVGARSAVFAPVCDLGLVVVDEEHDSSYKQSERLPYNGRDLALVRAREAKATVVLGSATPSVESYKNALDGRWRLLRLRKRVQARPMPKVEMVDLRTVLDPLERNHTLSPALAEGLAACLDAGEQAILFLNRRGYSSYALCRDCGDAIRCADCSVALVHHLSDGALRCHYCGASKRLPMDCPQCASKRVQLFGLGTEKCVEEVARRFPGARVIRLDSDSVAGRGKLQTAMERFAKGDADVLVGTQMVTKGHDIPGVTLVGVVLADLGLHLPDFRASERTFQLMTQVAGRAGRGERPGKVIIQSFLPKHESIVYANEHRYEEFMERELDRRRALGYPPTRRLMMIRLSHPDPAVVSKLAKSAGDLVRVEGRGAVELLGPVVSPLAKLRGRYRWQMLVKAGRIEALHRVAHAVSAGLPRSGGAKILFDVDPVDML